MTETEEDLRVMVVDDHPFVAKTLSATWPEASHDVVAVASNGRESMARFSATRPDMMVLELHIRARGGIELIGEFVRQNTSIRVLVH